MTTTEADLWISEAPHGKGLVCLYSTMHTQKKVPGPHSRLYLITLRPAHPSISSQTSEAWLACGEWASQRGEAGGGVGVGRAGVECEVWKLPAETPLVRKPHQEQVRAGVHRL